MHKKGTLATDRVDRLTDIGFQFVTEKTDNIKFSVVWDKSYQALKAFRDANGHVEVPAGFRPQPDMAELDGWITRQRKHHKSGKLPEHLRTKLVDIGVNLGGRGRPFGIENDQKWEETYQVLVEYCKRNGDCDVPEKFDDDPQLGKFICSPFKLLRWRLKYKSS